MEYQIVYFFNQLGRGTFVDYFSYFISSTSILIIFFLLLAVFCLLFDSKNGKWIFWGTIFVGLIYFIINDLLIKQTLANVFFRERPYLAYPDIIFPSPQRWIDSSFPSGHMSNIVALATLYIYFYRRWWVYVLSSIFILLMAFSRMHNGMHYPSDILAGVIFGLGYGLLAVLIVKKLKSS